MGETSDIVARPAAPIEPEAPPAPHGSAPAAVDAPRVRNRAQDTVDIVGTAETVRIRAVSAVRRSGWYVEGPLLLATVMFGLYAIMSIARFLRLDNGSWDLGMFTEAIKGYAHLGAPIADIRGPGFNLLGDHFHPILVLIAPFFRIFPSSITLLVAQAVLFAISMVPITRLAIRRLGIGAGYAIGIAYGLSWGLQSAADFDFHELAFAVPLLAFSLVALVDGRYRAAILWAMPLVLVKEDMGIFVAGIGVLVAIRGRKWWQGLGLSVFGLAASAVAILVFIPAFNPNGQYGFWQQIGGADPNSHPGMGGAFGALWDQFFTQADTKFITVFLLLLVTVFLALGSPVTLIAVVPLLLRFASANENYWGTAYHYNAPLMPLLFVAAIDTLMRIRARRAVRPVAAPRPAGASRAAASQAAASQAGTTAGTAAGDWLRSAFGRHGAAAMLAVSVALVSSFALGQYFHPQVMFREQPQVQAAWQALSLVPDGVTVEASLNVLAPLSARTDTYWIGNTTNPIPQYIVVDNANSDSPPAGPSADPLDTIEEQHGGVPFAELYVNNEYGIYVYRRAG